MVQDFNGWKEKLKESSDIVTTISKYVSLQKKGKTWWGNCPFHFEKTPSFAVNDMDQYYHCFGCGASGDVITFVSKIESCDFMEACEILAKDANMQMPVFKENDNINKLKKEREVAYNVLRDAALYYFNNLKLPQSKPAQDYLKRRKLEMDIIKAFGIGYSIGWNDIIEYLTKKGYSISDLKVAGLIEEKNGNYFDAYAKRLIFPIINSNNDVVGFSARILEESNFAKYKNTSQTVVFDKSKVLYGINNIKKLKQSQPVNEIIIVEGQMDLISIFKSGVKNAVATMGTSLTALHAKELKRYCDKVVVCFDGDGAGKKATLRSIEILNSAALDVYVASLPAGSDPDDYINKFGKNQFLELIESANYWVEFLILDFANSYDLNKPNEKSDFIINSLNVVKKLPSLSEQNVYLELIKKLSNISVDILRSDLNNLDNAKTVSEKKKDGDEGLQGLKENSYVKSVKFVLSSLLHKKEYATLNNDIKDNLLNGDYKRIYQYIEDSKANNKQPIISTLFDMFDVESNEDVKDLINFEFVENFDNEKYYRDCVNIIKVAGLQNMQAQLTAKLREISDPYERRKVLKELHEISLKISKQ